MFVLFAKSRKAGALKKGGKFLGKDLGMTKEELAGKLNGGEYRNEVSRLLADTAEKEGLVVVFGASDDITVFEGAIRDEGGYGCLYVGREGLFQSECPEGNDCPYFQASLILATKINAKWCDGGEGGPSWTYETDLPHATFMIYDEGEPYCEGIVFHIDDVK